MVSCASEPEKKERQENAIDLSGTYSVNEATGSDFSGTFVIQIENNDRSNLYVTMQRSGLTAKEESFLKDQLKLTDDQASQIASEFGSAFTLGEGKQNVLEGGESISDDFGATTRFHVYSKSFRIETETRAKYYNVTYHLTGTRKKSENTLRGALSLYVSEIQTTTRDDGKEVEESKFSTLSLNYTVGTTDYYRQYFGTWDGSLENWDMKLSGFGPTFRMAIGEDSSNEYFVQPTITQITYDGEVYQYDGARYDVQELKREIPALLIRYTSGTKSIRIVLEIQSLGNCVGTILGPDEIHRLGSLVLRKD